MLQYVALPSNGELPESSQIDSRFFDTKRKGKGGKRPKGDRIDWRKCKSLEPTSEEYKTECGQKIEDVSAHYYLQKLHSRNLSCQEAEIINDC